jgi:hypothetical protein
MIDDETDSLGYLETIERDKEKMIEINDWEVQQEKGLFVKVFTKKYDRSMSSFISGADQLKSGDKKKLIDDKITELKNELTDFINKERKS